MPLCISSVQDSSLCSAFVLFCYMFFFFVCSFLCFFFGKGMRIQVSTNEYYMDTLTMRNSYCKLSQHNFNRRPIPDWVCAFFVYFFASGCFFFSMVAIEMCQEINLLRNIEMIMNLKPQKPKSSKQYIKRKCFSVS